MKRKQSTSEDNEEAKGRQVNKLKKTKIAFKLWKYFPNAVSNSTMNYMNYLQTKVMEVTQGKQLDGIFGYPQPRIQMYCRKDKTILHGSDYKYSGVKPHEGSWNDALESLAEIASKIIQENYKKDVTFTAALVNLYRDEKDSVGAHQDKDAQNEFIASFSFGATRILHIHKPRDDDSKKMNVYAKILMEDKSLIIMEPGMQIHFYHEVKKTKKPCGPRINVTLRMH